MTQSSVQLARGIAQHFGSLPPQRLGVAVSGGSDSVALLVLLADWSRTTGAHLEVVTVDHGLRPAAADEARGVAQKAADLGLLHQVLAWKDWDGSGNLMDQARRARYDLITNWAHERGLSHVALGHTQDDVAETFLMRLSRTAGVDGLAAMPARRKYNGIYLVRPLLGVSREDLRAELRRRGLDWVEDPSNEDSSFDRVKVRKAMKLLAPLGMDAQTLAAVSQNLAKARQALNWHTSLAAREVVQFDAGDLLIERKGWRALNDEIARRLLRTALGWVAGTEYGPRQAALALAMDAINAGQDMTLHGCQILSGKTHIRICREYNAVREITSTAGENWDGRWSIDGPWENGMHVAPLGEQGLQHVKDWREAGRPRASALASPAIWQAERLIAAPLVGVCNGWSATLIKCEDMFFSTFLP